MIALIKRIVVSVAAMCVCVSVGSAFTVINPVAGEWANRQTLVIDLADGEEAYYSLTGTNPTVSGFIYDGPVLLDITGDVVLCVTVIDAERTHHDVVVTYAVRSPAVPAESRAADFCAAVSAEPLVSYVSGDELVIPETLRYRFDSRRVRWLSGRPLSLSVSNTVGRIVPCMVTDGSSVWRFIIDVQPRFSGTFTRRTVPFEIVDWSTVICTDRRYIYQIDGSMWLQPQEPVVLDRSVGHVISWQSVSYVKGNPISTYVLPPRPHITTTHTAQQSSTITVGGEGFRLGVLGTDGQAPELFETISIDAFVGEQISGTVPVGVYYNSVYHGTEFIPFVLNRLPPEAPVITTDGTGGYARGAVDVTVSVMPGDALYVASVSERRAVLANGGTVPALPSHELYTPTAAESVRLRLVPIEHPVVYVVSAYAVDAAGNRSELSTYTVTIDSYNFYVSASADRETADGSREHPYADLISCLADVA
ncbi:MAG: hypothetical protein IJ191_03510, partial [Treponema sp.]|nr:hypothetical protein [Treponema sp.]